MQPTPTGRGQSSDTSSPRRQVRPQRSPFDRIGVLALVWAALFAAAALGLMVAIG